MFERGIAKRRDWAVGVLLSLTLCATAAIYHPGLSGPFLFDDFGNIVKNPYVLIDDFSLASLRQAAVSGRAGPLKRPITMLSFGVNHASSALDESRWKVTNLAIHLLNGVLVFLVVRRLFALYARGRGDGAEIVDWIALATAAIWLVHPVLLSSVLYVVQRMTSLASTFVLIGLWFYLGARAAQLAGRPASIRLFVVVPVCTVFAVLAKESGALLPFFACAIELSLLRFRVGGGLSRRGLDVFYLVLVVLPLAGFAVFLTLNPGWLEWAGAGRGFSVLERLMTEARVLFFYLKILVVPVISDLALYHDDIVISRGLLSPPSTIIALTALGFLTVFACFARARLPLFAFAAFWFLAAHAMESTVIMLELVHVHRNYLAYIGPIAAAITGLLQLSKQRKTAVVIGLSVVFSAFALITLQRASQWSDAVRMAQFEIYHHPQSPRANYEIGRLYAVANADAPNDEYFEKAHFYLSRAGELSARDIGPTIGLITLDFTAGRTPDPKLVDDLEASLRNNHAIALQFPYIDALVECQKGGVCKLHHERILRIIGLALSSAADNPILQSRILLTLGSYYAYLGDLDACRRVIEDAHRFVPDQAGPLVSLIQVYLLTGQADEAAAMLRKARAVDGTGLHAKELRALESDVAALRGALHE